MSESKSVWRKLKKRVPGLWIRLEVLNLFGIPDCLVLQQDGRVAWVELKYMKSWPKRNTTQTTLGISPAQSHFIGAWIQKGGRGYVLVRVGNEFLLCPGHKLDKKTKQQWINQSIGRWILDVDYEELGALL